jgi:hypothetical protein
MTKLKDKIKTALDESRMLILGAQILLGFQYRAVLEKQFEFLPFVSQYLHLAALTILLSAIALMMSPSAYHRIVHEGEDSQDVHEFTTTVMDIALLPFIGALAIDLYVMIGRVLGVGPAVILGGSVAAFALIMWYAIEFLGRRGHWDKEAGNGSKKEGSSEMETALKDKVDHVLTEAKVVLPGAQALLGFQFITILMEGFDRLPQSSKYVHIFSLTVMAITVVILMTPAAYHRMVEHGKNTEHFHAVASVLIISAMVLLPMAIAGDFYVVVQKVTASARFAIGASSGILLFFYLLWFAFTTYRRYRIIKERGK